jgi:hypothetical protein
MINPIEIQESLFFENDGEIDLLTGAMAPNRFNQIVKRDIEMAERNGASLAIISVKLDLGALLDREFKDQTKPIQDQLKPIKDHTKLIQDKSKPFQDSKEILRYQPIFTIKSEIESFLVEVNFNLKSILRGSDCISRVSRTGFWIFVNSATPEGLQLLENRIKKLIPDNFYISIIPREANQDQLSWYQSIDLKHFS